MQPSPSECKQQDVRYVVQGAEKVQGNLHRVTAMKATTLCTVSQVLAKHTGEV